VCDAWGRFLDISITYGGVYSDLLSFKNSTLFKRLESGTLVQNFVLFGDNPDLNTLFIATPHLNTNSVPKDNYNFYHSQLHIRIECAFGMFVQRWGILRMAPNGMMMKKTIALVNALAKLHNFYIDTNDGSITDSNVDEALFEDLVNMVGDSSGFVPLVLLGGDTIFNTFLCSRGTTVFNTVWKKLQIAVLINECALVQQYI